MSLWHAATNLLAGVEGAHGLYEALTAGGGGLWTPAGGVPLAELGEPIVEHAGHASSLGTAASSGLGALGLATGAFELGQGAAKSWDNVGKEEAEGNIEVLRGLSGIISGGATLGVASGALTGGAAAAAGAAGPLAAAAGVGLMGGQALGDALWGNSQGGMWGTEEIDLGDGTTMRGKDKDAFDAAADWGNSAESWVQDLFGAKEGSGSAGDIAGGIAGGIAAAAGGIVNGAIGAGALFASLFD